MPEKVTVTVMRVPVSVKERTCKRIKAEVKKNIGVNIQYTDILIGALEYAAKYPQVVYGEKK